MRLLLTLAALALTASFAEATTIQLDTATGLLEPSFRGGANTTWTGWDLFDDNGTGDRIINDATPDIGTDGGSFVTTNGEEHISGSRNYYSGGGSVSEDILFDVDGAFESVPNPNPFGPPTIQRPLLGDITVIVQAETLFGPFGTAIDFSPIEDNGGNLHFPTQVAQATNANGQGQLFVKYEFAGIDGQKQFSISGGAMNSIGLFVVDTLWSPTGFAPDGAIVPEPAAALLMMVGAVLAASTRR